MHRLLAVFPLLVAQAHVGHSMGQGRPGHGLVGFSIDMYKPACTYACASCFNGQSIECSDAASFEMPGMSMKIRSALEGASSNVTTTASSACLAQSTPYLTSVAWCIQTKCENNTLDWEVEKWWQYYVVGNMPSDPPPSISYGAAIALISPPPDTAVMKGLVLNTTRLADQTLYTALYNSLDVNQNVEIQHERFALVAVISGGVIPVVFSLFRFLPFPTRWVSALEGRFINPLLLKPSWRSSALSAVIEEPPTRGQALFIAYLVLLNVLLSSFSYHYNPLGWGYWYNNGPDEIMGDLANRLGVLSFANFVLVVLYSSRNNLLLWLTNWHHSTFILLHRWVARIAAVEAILHSLIFLRDYMVESRLATDQTTPYWYWGCIATIAVSLLLPLSLPIMRQHRYEAFLAIHIIFAILVFVGSWYHIIYRYEHQWGYETWLYIVFAIWGFDRLIRCLRVLRHGIRTVTVTSIDEEYTRIDLKGVTATGHVYIYFLSWRFWENHPFSVASSVIQRSDVESQSSSSSTALPTHTANDLPISEMKASTSIPSKPKVRNGDSPVETGLVFYLRLHDGITKTLRGKSKLKVAVEASYGHRQQLSDYPTLVCIAGGVGVTAVLPYLRAHPGNTFLYWSSRSQALVDSIEPLIDTSDNEIVVGQRLDIEAILEGHRGDFAIVVSGPIGMIDAAREVASKLSGERRVKFIAESFTY